MFGPSVQFPKGGSGAISLPDCLIITYFTYRIAFLVISENDELIFFSL